MLSHRNLLWRRERQPVPRQRRARRDPRGAAAQLRRRLQPADDRLHRRRSRRADELPVRRATWCGSARKHRVTGLTCVPPLWIQLTEQEWPAEAHGALRYFANTGGRMPRSTLGKLRAIFPQAKPYLMYGLTEAFRSTYLDPAEVDRRPDSIGKAIPNAEILVVRPDGTPCEPGEEGELVHRGALVALGYWNDPERTAARFRPAPGRLDGNHDHRARGVVRRHRQGRRGGLPLLRRAQRRDDQDLRLPGQPDRDRGGRLRHRARARRGRARRRGSAPRPADRARREPGRRTSSIATRCSPRSGSSCRSTWSRATSSSAPSCRARRTTSSTATLLRQELAA